MNLLSKKILSILTEYNRPVTTADLFAHRELCDLFMEVEWEECFGELIECGVVVVSEIESDRVSYSVVNEKLEEVLSE